MKFLADEHIELSIVTGLKLLGIDVISINEAGKRGSDDEEILSFARKNDRVVITRDSDFLKLHSKGIEHAGIVFVQKFLEIGKVIGEIEKVSMIFEPEHIRNNVVFIPVKNHHS